MKKLILFILPLASLLWLVTQGEKLSYETASGISFCVRNLVPKLFIFFCFSAFLAESGICDEAAVSFNGFGYEISAFVFGLLAGFPTGAVIANHYYKNGMITKKRGEYILTFSNNVSISFLFFYVSKFIGTKGAFCIFLCQLFSSFAFFAVGRFFLGFEDKKSYDSFCLKAKNNLAQSFVTAIKRGTESMISVCGIIIFFSCFCEFVPSNIFGFLELTRGIELISSLPYGERLFISSAFVGFCGFSVHCQTASVCDLGMKKYMAVKIISLFVFPFFTKFIFNLL